MLPECYFVQFLFPTRDYIAVHGEFFDVITDATKGRLTDEYYYSDVTSVRTETRAPVLEFLQHEEATTLRLTVASGDAVEVRFLDRNLQHTLNEYIEEQRKASADPAARKRIRDMDKESVANQVVRDVRHQLRVRKGS